MAVEARVSVQAMKGRFEQLHDDTPQLATPSPTPKPGTSPLRLRSASVSGKAVSCSSQDGKHAERFLDSREEVRKQLSSKPAKGTQSEEAHKNRSFLAGIVSPVFLGSRGLLRPASSKKSLEKIGTSESNLADKRCEHDTEETPVHRVSDGSSALKKPSVVRRIPVFKSVDQGLDNRAGEGIGNANGDVGEHERKKIIGHLRSRSHGNFIVTRDLGDEKHISEEEKNSVIKNKENVWHKDVIVKTFRQKSSDNLFNNRDAKSDYSFEGKQKLVATVVKNMKNKEKPTVLRKLSFSSKIEKDLKNKKEKAVTPAKKEKQPVLPAPSSDKIKKWKDHEQKTDKTFTSVKKIEIKARYPSEGKKSPPTVNLLTSDAVIQTAAIAKAVADIAASKAEMMRGEDNESECVQANIAKVSPPTRPPRRRVGPTPRKKSRAPSPPGPPVESFHSQKHDLSEEEASSSHLHTESQKTIDIYETRMLAEIQLNDRTFPDGFSDSHMQQPDQYKSSDSLATSKTSNRSRQNSPVMSSDGSPVWVKRTSLSSLSPSRGSSPVEGAFGALSKSENEANFSDEQCFKHDSENQTFKCGDVARSPKGYHGGNTSESKFEYPEKKDPECLPIGPPPKKPPRTFAYDIYKNSKISRSICESTENSDSTCDNTKSSCEKLTSTEPVYAIPVKKKRSEKKIETKPPIRSNSDLSKKDLVKPSVAPKPPHIVTKAKRASMVDPLSCAEKDEEAAMTSEFQRQAHIRYSLRRPKKPPPAPPQCPEADGALAHDMGSSTDVARTNVNVSADSQANVSSYNSFESQEDHQSNFSVRSCTSSPNDLNHSVTPDLEASPTAKSFSSGQSIVSNDSDHTPVSSLRQTSRSTYNLRTASPSGDDDQPSSLIHCPTASPTTLSGFFRKRSMSDETLYKGARHGDEPIYATPIFPNSKGSSGHSRQRELHYMCSVLFTDEEEADAGRDGSRSRRNRSGTDTSDGNKGRASIISAWKREFRQSCRHVQNKIKKSVIR